MQQFAANQLYISSLGYPRKEPPFYPYFTLFCPKSYLAIYRSNIDDHFPYIITKRMISTLS